MSRYDHKIETSLEGIEHQAKEEKERCSGSYRLAVDFILIKDYVNFSETRLVTVMKSLHRSCWTELTCQGILLP